MDVIYRPIDPDRLRLMREAGEDEFGNPWRPRTAHGWEPLRCCLRTAEKAADIALISYSPWPLPWSTPWAEAGPVFVCDSGCPGYSQRDRYPDGLRGQHLQLNPFDHTGARAYRHLRFVEPDEDPEAAVREVLAKPDVAHLHVRSAIAQCFTFEARRA
jgi:hypothetical protein